MKIKSKLKNRFWSLRLFLIVVFFLCLAVGPAWSSQIITYEPTPVERNIGEKWNLSIFLMETLIQ